VPFNYAIVPIFLVDTLLVVATILTLLKRDLALSAYSFVDWPNATACPAINSLSFR
jgi:hypothetical protein